MRVIVTGVTGLVGEGVLLECLDNPAVDHVLAVSRRGTGRTHPKLEELLVADFMELDGVKDKLTGYDACFYCAGKSSVGMNEADYTHLTYDTALHFARVVLELNPDIAMCHVSGASTDESSKQMWARVKARTENALLKMPFKKVYNFRPALMVPSPGQKHAGLGYRIVVGLWPLFGLLLPNKKSTLVQVGRAMIHAAQRGAPKPILEVPDLNALADAA